MSPKSKSAQPGVRLQATSYVAAVNAGAVSTDDSTSTENVEARLPRIVASPLEVMVAPPVSDEVYARSPVTKRSPSKRRRVPSSKRPHTDIFVVPSSFTPLNVGPLAGATVSAAIDSLAVLTRKLESTANESRE